MGRGGRIGVALAFAGAATVALAADAYLDALAAYGSAPDASGRLLAVQSIGAAQDPRSVPVLERIVRGDRDIAVCVAAADALGEVANERAGEAVTRLLYRGGFRLQRVALAKAIMKCPGGRTKRNALLLSPQSDQLGRALVVQSLAFDPELDTLEILTRALNDDDAVVRCAALRAMSEHEYGKLEIGESIVACLRAHADLDTRLTALDLLEDHAFDRLEEAEKVLRHDLRPQIVATLDELRAVREYRQKLEDLKRAEKDGYAVAESDRPVEPARRRRLDLILAFDASGSNYGAVSGMQRRVQAEIDPVRAIRCDVRLGIVAFRDRPKSAGQWETRVLPLTYSGELASEFLLTIRGRGTDAQGSSIEAALEEALDRMPWRRHARREVFVITDSKAGDPDSAVCTAGRHREADGTQTSVSWIAHTRVKVPESLKRIADAGGGTFLGERPEPPPQPGPQPNGQR